MLLVFGPAQARRQFQIAEDIVVRFAERGIGIQHIGIFAQKIIVSIVVEMGNRIWIDIYRWL